MFFLFHSWFHACQFLKRHNLCVSQNHFMFRTDVNILFLVEINLYGNSAQNFLLLDRLLVCSKILTKRLPRGTFTLHYFNSRTDFENSENTLNSKTFCEYACKKRTTHSYWTLQRKYFKQKKGQKDHLFSEHQVIGYSRSILSRFVLEKQGGAIKDDRAANSTKGAGGPPGM